MSKQLLKSSLMSSMIAISIGLTACGGDDSSGSGSATTPTTTATSTTGATVPLIGKVYISGAKVCLDKNANKVCDLDESNAITGSDGSYSFDVTDTDKAAYPVVAEIPVGAIRRDGSNSTITKKYILTSPTGKSALISPLTTMVQNELEGNPSLTTRQAETQLLTKMAVADSAVSLFEDYIDKSNANTNSSNAGEYDRLRMIARVTETTIANNMETIEAVAAVNGTTLTVDNLISMVVDEVVAALDEVVVVVDDAIVAGRTSATFDETTAVVATVIDTSTELDVAIANEVIADTSTATTSLQTIFNNGIYWIGSDTYPAGYRLNYGNFGIDSATGTLFDSESEYDPAVSNVWVSDSGNGDTQLTSSGWVVVASESATVSETNGVMSVSLSITDVMGITHAGQSVDFSASVVDLSGLNMTSYLSSVPKDEDDPTGYINLISGTATFPAGAESYTMNETNTNSVVTYSGWDNGWCDATTRANLGGLCTAIWPFNGSNPVSFSEIFMTTATDLTNPIDAGSYTGTGVMIGEGLNGASTIYAEFIRTNVSNTNGVIQIFEHDWSANTITALMTTTWDMVTVNGQQILRNLLPLSQELQLTSQGYEFWTGHEGMIYSYLGFLREGEYNSIGQTYTFINFNQTATDAVFTAAGLPVTP